MEMNIRSVVLFVMLFIITYTNCMQGVVPVSRRINGLVFAVSETYIFTTVYYGNSGGNSSVVAYQKYGTSFDPHDGIAVGSAETEPGDCFGCRMAANRKSVVVGAPAHDNLKGAVFIYAIDGQHFTLKQKLLPDGGEDEIYFGFGVFINKENEEIVIGSDHGVYIFAYQNFKWIKVQKLSHHIGLPICDISGNILVVSVAHNVYIYTRYGGLWTLIQTLPPQKYDSRDVPVKIYEQDVYVGLIGSKDSNRGNVYIYKPTSPPHRMWIHTDTLTGSARSFNDSHDWFGGSLAFYDTIMVVSASGFSFNASTRQAGLAYIFQFNSQRQVWVEKAQLKASDSSENDNFSEFVDMGEHFVFLGKEGSSHIPYTYIYEYNNVIVDGAYKTNIIEKHN